MALDLLAFGLVVLFALIGSVLATRLGQSPIVGVLFVGALVGPAALNLVQYSEVINSFADIGAVLLLFTIGIGLNLRRVLRFGLRALMVGAFKIIFIILVTYQAGLLFGLQETDAMLLSITLSITSTAIFASMVRNMSTKDTHAVDLLMAVLILEDIFGILVLTVLTSYSSIASAVNLKSDILLPIAQGFVVLAVSYAIIQRAMKPIVRELARHNNELLIICSIALCALMSALSDTIGLQASIGAFLAGTIVSSLDEFKGIENSLLPFISVFSLFFFFTIGMQVHLSIIYTAFGLLLLVTLLNVFLKFFTVTASTFFLGFDSREAIFSGVAMLSVGEFSLLISKAAAPYTSIDLLGLISVTVLVSTALSTAGTRNIEPIESILHALLPKRLRVTFTRVSIYLNQVVAAFEPKGLFFSAFLTVWSSVAFDLAMLVMINGGIYLLVIYFIVPYSISILPWVETKTIAELIGLLFSLPFLLSLFRGVKRLLDALTESFLMAEGRHDALDMRIYNNLKMFALFILIAFGWPLAVVYFKLPRFFNWLGVLPIFMCILHLWDMSRAIHYIFERQRDL